MPLELENGYVAFEDLPNDRRKLPSLEDDDDEDDDDEDEEEDSDKDEEEIIYDESESL